MKVDAEHVKSLVEKGRAVINTPTKHTPSQNAVDGPVLGNGDMGAVVKTEEDGYVFLLGKNDFWRQPYLYETEEQRKEKFLRETCRRTGGRIIPAGWLRLQFPGLKQTKYYMVQNPYDAHVDIDVEYALGIVSIKSWICAVQNTLVIEINNYSGKDARIDLSLMAGEYDIYEVEGYDDGYAGNTVWFTYGAEPYYVPGRRVVAACARVDTDIEFDSERMAKKGGLFTVRAGMGVRLFLTLLSNLDSEDPKEAVLSVNQLACGEFDRLWQQHTRWWREFWEKSTVETGDEVLDSYYYSSLYWLGCCTREGKVPPGLYGCWTTSNLALWSGAYTLNYNYESPFYCLYTANRQELAKSYIEPLLDSIPMGEWFAREKFGHRGICLPVEIGPWGIICSGNFFHQKTNAANCCSNIFMHFFSTYDEEWGRRAYPFVKKTAEFWEDDLVYEDGVYDIVNDAAHEEVVSEGERNNSHALGIVNMLFCNILKMSEALHIDGDRREKWQHIVEHLAPFPWYMRNGQKVFKYNEDNYEWKDANGTPVKFIYPFGCIGLDSDKELLEMARNTLEQKDYLFYQANAYCEYVQMRARVKCDPEKTFQAMKKGCQMLSWSNRYMIAHGGGIEDFSAIPGGINEMLLQGHEGVIRVFPSWPEERDANFVNLRAYGAFLVSSKKEEGQVRYVEIESEKGKRLIFINPWECAELEINGIKSGQYTDKKIALGTKAGDIFVFRKAKRVER